MEMVVAQPGGLAEHPPPDVTAGAGSGRAVLHAVDMDIVDEGEADSVLGSRRGLSERKTTPIPNDKALDAIGNTGDSCKPSVVGSCASATAAASVAVAAATAMVDAAVRAADGIGEALATTPMNTGDAADGKGRAGAGGPSGGLVAGTTAGTPTSAVASMAAAAPASAPAVALGDSPAAAGTPMAAGLPVSAATTASGAALGGPARPQSRNWVRPGEECEDGTHDVLGLNSMSYTAGPSSAGDVCRGETTVTVMTTEVAPRSPPPADANAVKLLAVAPRPPVLDGQKDEEVAAAAAASAAATAVMAGSGGTHRVVANISAEVHGVVTVVGEAAVAAADDTDFEGLSFARVFAEAKARVVSAEAAVAAAGPSVGEFGAATATLEVAVTALETIASCARRCRALQRLGRGGVEGDMGPPSVKRART